jgi:hypothetical protein
MNCIATPLPFILFCASELHFRPLSTGNATLALLTRRTQAREIDTIDTILSIRNSLGET